MDEFQIANIDAHMRDAIARDAKENEITDLGLLDRSQLGELAVGGTAELIAGLAVDEACKARAIKAGRRIAAWLIRRSDVLIGKLDDAGTVIDGDAPIFMLGCDGDDSERQNRTCKDQALFRGHICPPFTGIDSRPL